MMIRFDEGIRPASAANSGRCFDLEFRSVCRFVGDGQDSTLSHIHPNGDGSFLHCELVNERDALFGNSDERSALQTEVSQRFSIRFNPFAGVDFGASLERLPFNSFVARDKDRAFKFQNFNGGAAKGERPDEKETKPQADGSHV